MQRNGISSIKMFEFKWQWGS